MGHGISEFLQSPVPAGVPVALALLLLVAFGVVGAIRQQMDSFTRALAGVADGRVVGLAPTGVNPDARAAVVIPNQGSPYLIVRVPGSSSRKSVGGVGAEAGDIRRDSDPGRHD